MSRTLTVLSVVIVVLAAIMVGQPSPLSAAQADDSSYADHPLTGVWLVNTGMDFTPTTFNADGSATFGYASNYVDPVVGLTFQGPGLAAWEPVDEQTGRFSMFQASLTRMAPTSAASLSKRARPLARTTKRSPLSARISATSSYVTPWATFSLMT